MKANLVATLIELALGLFVGYLSFQFSNQSDPLAATLSIVLGLLSAILAANLAEPFLEERSLRGVTSKLDRILDGLADRSLGAAEIAGVLKYATLAVPREHTTRVWLELLWGSKSRYWGTIYTAPTEVVDTSTFQLGFAALSAKIRVDQVDVRRIFIVDTETELAHLEPAFAAAVDAQMKVKVILRAEIDRHPLLQAQLGRLPTLDFVVIDSRVVWFLLLDRQRRIRSGEVSWDQPLSIRCAEVFGLLWEAAKHPHVEGPRRAPIA